MTNHQPKGKMTMKTLSPQTIKLNFKDSKDRVCFNCGNLNVEISKGKKGFIVSASSTLPTDTLFMSQCGKTATRTHSEGFQSAYGSLPTVEALNEYLAQFDVVAVEEMNTELTEEEKALKIKNTYNLNLKSNRVILAKRVIKGGQKTVLLNYGFSNKRAKVWFVELRNRIFLTVGGSGYKLTLDQFINGDFEIKRIPKEPQVLRSSNGWASLENLMNKTWSK